AFEVSGAATLSVSGGRGAYHLRSCSASTPTRNTRAYLTGFDTASLSCEVRAHFGGAVLLASSASTLSPCRQNARSPAMRSVAACGCPENISTGPLPPRGWKVSSAGLV